MMLLIFLKKAKENLAMILLKVMMKVLYHKILFYYVIDLLITMLF